MNQAFFAQRLRANCISFELIHACSNKQYAFVVHAAFPFLCAQAFCAWNGCQTSGPGSQRFMSHAFLKPTSSRLCEKRLTNSLRRFLRLRALLPAHHDHLSVPPDCLNARLNARLLAGTKRHFIPWWSCFCPSPSRASAANPTGCAGHSLLPTSLSKGKDNFYSGAVSWLPVSRRPVVSRLGTAVVCAVLRF